MQNLKHLRSVRNLEERSYLIALYMCLKSFLTSMISGCKVCMPSKSGRNYGEKPFSVGDFSLEKSDGRFTCVL